jgi:hypothetical protein
MAAKGDLACTPQYSSAQYSASSVKSAHQPLNAQTQKRLRSLLNRKWAWVFQSVSMKVLRRSAHA